MKLFKRSEKKAEMTRTQTAAKITDLEQLCGGDKDVYEALHHTMFLDPRKLETSVKDAVAKAEAFASEKDTGRARIWYDVAGGLAIYEGKTDKVVELFSEAEKISGMKYPILKNPERAVQVAQEYYKKHLKD